MIDLSDTESAAAQRRFRPSRSESITIEPEGDRVRVRCEGALNARAAAQLRTDCEELLDRGWEGVIVDLTHATTIAPAVVSAIAFIDHHARGVGSRFSVAPGSGHAATTLRRAGLLGQLALEGAPEMFWEWTR